MVFQVLAEWVSHLFPDFKDEADLRSYHPMGTSMVLSPSHRQIKTVAVLHSHTPNCQVEASILLVTVSPSKC